MLMIRIHHSGIWGGCSAKTLDSGTGQPATPDALDYANTRINQSQRSRFVRSPVSRVVIDDQDFPNRLAKRGINPLDQRAQIAPLSSFSAYFSANRWAVWM